jgi:prevent-host-death family protein
MVHRAQETPMEVSVTDAKAQLTDLVRRAEAGEEVVLTRRGQPVARIAPVAQPRRREGLKAFLDALAVRAAAEALPGPDAARSADFLYDEDGLPK